ncbi:DHA1 family inner membrane transport protein [Bradyrhizobium sp. i1.3.1]
MENPPAAGRFTATALMLGNLVTGCSVLAPAGMLPELATGLDVSIHAAGLLITFGAVTLCIGSPLTAWLTSRIDRRTLLATTLAVLALGNLASAFAPDYTSLLIIRLLMLAVGALYTPQAAGTAALIVPVKRRGSTIAYIFLGWSLAAAVGLPLITFIASRYGWRAAYGGIGALGCISFLLLLLRLPAGLKGTPVDLKTWSAVGRSRTILLLLAITMLQMSGQFVVFTFMGPLLKKLTEASPDAIGMVFGIYGVCGFLGVVIATRIVDTWGPYRTSLLFTCLLFAGITGWALGAGKPGIHGVRGRDLGPRLCLNQFDAASAAGRGCAAARIGDRRAQHLRPLCRPGCRLRHRRAAVRPRTAAFAWFRRGRLRRPGADPRGSDPAPAGCCHHGLKGAFSYAQGAWQTTRGSARRRGMGTKES